MLMLVSLPEEVLLECRAVSTSYAPLTATPSENTASILLSTTNKQKNTIKIGVFFVYNLIYYNPSVQHFNTLAFW